MKIILLTFFLLASLPAFSNDEGNSVINGPEAEKIFNDLHAYEYSAAAITEYLEYKMIVRYNDTIKCQKSITTYKKINQVEVEFECTEL